MRQFAICKSRVTGGIMCKGARHSSLQHSSVSQTYHLLQTITSWGAIVFSLIPAGRSVFGGVEIEVELFFGFFFGGGLNFFQNILSLYHP